MNKTSTQGRLGGKQIYQVFPSPSQRYSLFRVFFLKSLLWPLFMPIYAPIQIPQLSTAKPPDHHPLGTRAPFHRTSTCTRFSFTKCSLAVSPLSSNNQPLAQLGAVAIVPSHDMNHEELMRKTPAAKTEYVCAVRRTQDPIRDPVPLRDMGYMQEV